MGSVLLLLVLFIGLPVAILWSRDRVSDAFWRRRNPPEEQDAERRVFTQRLLNPDWSFYQRHLQRPVPDALRGLFADSRLITSADVAYGEEVIGSFEAIDEAGLLDTREWIGVNVVAIATTMFGDPIYLRPGPSEPDVVYVTYHDGGETHVLAESVAEMAERLRRSASAPEQGAAGDVRPGIAPE